MAHNFHRIAILLMGILMKSNAQTVEIIDSSPVTGIGASPFWCKETQSLYYCDQVGIQCAIFRYCATDGKIYCASVDGYPSITFIVPIEAAPDEYAVGTPKSVEIVQWDGKSPKAKWIRTVFTAENCTEYETNIITFARTDEYGRLFVNTRRTDICANLDTIQTYGNLFRIGAGESPVTLIKPGTLRFPGGMAWDEKNDIFYFTDVCAYNIMAYDYCPHTGDIWNRRIIFNLTEGTFSLDRIRLILSLEIDKDCNLWVSGAGEIYKMDPRTGKILLTIPMPVLQATGAVFGGPCLDELYVTSTTYYTLPPGVSEARLNEGRLFVVRDIGACGCEVNKAKL